MIETRITVEDLFSSALAAAFAMSELPRRMLMGIRDYERMVYGLRRRHKYRSMPKRVLKQIQPLYWNRAIQHIHEGQKVRGISNRVRKAIRESLRRVPKLF